MTTGAIVHWLRFEGIITELYDVQVIPTVQKPMDAVANISVGAKHSGNKPLLLTYKLSAGMLRPSTH